MHLFKKNFKKLMKNNFNLDSYTNQEAQEVIQSFFKNHDIHDYKILHRFPKDLNLFLKLECPTDTQESKENTLLKRQLKDLRFSMDEEEKMVCGRCSKKETCSLINKIPPQKKANISQLIQVLHHFNENSEKLDNTILIKNWIQMTRICDTLNILIEDMMIQEGKESKHFINVHKEEMKQTQKLQSQRFGEYQKNINGEWNGVQIQSESSENDVKTQIKIIKDTIIPKQSSQNNKTFENQKQQSVKNEDRIQNNKNQKQYNSNDQKQLNSKKYSPEKRNSNQSRYLQKNNTQFFSQSQTPKIKKKLDQEQMDKFLI